jgi:hypothetical protein
MKRTKRITNIISLFRQIGRSPEMHHLVSIREDDGLPWEDFRDPLATRLLDFTPRPQWKNKGSSYFENPELYGNCDLYRHLISRIIIGSIPRVRTRFRDDSDGIFKIDWLTLPRLKYLALDLLPFILSSWGRDWQEYEPQFHDLLFEEAKRMAVLELKELFVHGFEYSVPPPEWIRL